MRNHDNGFQLMEMALVLALLSALVTLGVPPLLQASAALRVRLAAGEIEGALRLARSEAVLRSGHVGVRFDPDAPLGPTFALFVDGDGDGVRSSDIARGIDPAHGPARPLTHFGRGVGFGIPPGVSPPDPGNPSRRLGRLHDPIRFNSSNIASFGPLGGSTPGSLYLTDGRRELVVVRVFGRTGKVRLLRYDAAEDAWK